MPDALHLVKIEAIIDSIIRHSVIRSDFVRNHENRTTTGPYRFSFCWKQQASLRGRARANVSITYIRRPLYDVGTVRLTSSQELSDPVILSQDFQTR